MQVDAHLRGALRHSPRHLTAQRRIARAGLHHGAGQQRLQQQGFENSRRMVGDTQRILVTDYSKKDPGMLQGRNEFNRVVNFRSDNPLLIGQFVDCEIMEAMPFSLLGRYIAGSEH